MLAKAISAQLTIELAESILYADDSAAEIVKEFKNGKLTLGVDNIGKSAAAALVGAITDDNGVLISASEDGGAPVAIGFRAQKANGHYRYFWLYRVKFGVPSANLTTKGDSITFSTPTIEGTVSRRNKADDNGKHPWKAEVDADDDGVDVTVIGSWYTQVYEPVFSTSP
jgi:phi13 family phage major tail protein